ncbi:MAG: hypothetical protein AVO35_12360 [Candidatus Aegiribacteria sp. MLS_C]|nr:MAG: hypothetical protein AVO35_12360 [Candidatus Aegiribacteria sp. MLS_C]
MTVDRVLVLSAAALVLSCGEGREGPGQAAETESAAAEAPFVNADSAAQAVTECSYGFLLYGTGSLQEEPRVVGTVAGRVLEGEDAPLLRVSLGYDSVPDDGIAPEASLLLVSGTDSAYAYNLQDSILEKGSLNEGGTDLLRPAAYVIMNEFFIDGPFSDEIGADSILFSGNAEVDGVPCTQWLVDYRGGSRALWSLGVEDHLPRRVERMITGRDGEPLSVILEISGLEINSGLPDSLFEMGMPASEVIGYSAFLTVGTAAPEWTLPDRHGEEVSLSDLRGRIVVLDFWATWCGPCEAVMPAVQAVHESYPGDEVAVFGVNVWEDGDPAAFMDEMGFTYGLLLNGDHVAEDYLVSGIPTMYVIDPEGMVAFVEVGANPDIAALLDEAVGRLLRED